MSDMAGGRSAIDPRIRARRIAVQRDVGRKRLRRLGFVLAGVAVVAAGWGVTRTPLLDVDRLEIRGATNTGAAAVLTASGLHTGDAMLTAPLGRAAHGVAALPWVQTVHVHRRWPGTVVIEIAERRPVAYLPATTGVVLVDAERRELGRTDTPPAGLLRLDVPAIAARPGSSAPASIRPVLDVAATVPKALADRIVSLRPEQDGTVSGSVRLRNGAEAALLLGAPTQTAAKWLALATVLDEVDPARLASIDVRVPGAPALTRR